MPSISLKDGQRAELLVLDHKDRSSCWPELARVKDFILQPHDPWFRDFENTTLLNRSLSKKEELTGIGSDFLFLATLNHEPVGSAWYQVAGNSTEVGACAFVFTDPSHRGLGIAHELMRCLVSHFGERNGLAMYLGTSNPVARSVYEKVGFRVYNGVVMRKIYEDASDPEFDDRFYAGGDQTRIRGASWGDLARLTALYAFPHPWFIKDYGARIFSHPELPMRRCVTIPVSLLLRGESGSNRLLVMEDSRDRLVGALSVYREDPARGEEAALDFLVLPSYVRDLPSLLDEGCRTASSMGTNSVDSYASEFDQGKKEALTEVGFEPTRTAREEPLPSGGAVSVQLYQREL